MPRTRTYAKGEARRQEILVAAFDTLAEHGYHRTSVRDIAKAVGMEPAHVLYYFGSRERLLQEVLVHWDSPSSAAADWRDPAKTLDIYVDTVRGNAATPGIVRLYLNYAAEATDPEHASHAYFRGRFERLQLVLAESVEAAKAAGRFRPDVDAADAAATLIALGDGLQLQALVDGRTDAAAGLERYLATLEPVTPRPA